MDDRITTSHMMAVHAESKEAEARKLLELKRWREWAQSINWGDKFRDEFVLKAKR